MSNDRSRVALGQAGHRRPSLPYAMSVVTLILGLMVTQLWPQGLSAAPMGAGPENTDIVYQAQKPETLPRGGPVIVVLKPGAASQVAAVARSVGARPTQVYGEVFPGFAANLPDQAIRGLARNPNVAFISADLPVQAAAQTIPVNLRRAALDSSPTAAIDGVDNPINADIAIVDTGVNSHSDLRIAGGYNCTSTDRGAWGDSDGHGTHVAGTAAAIDNGTGVVGSAPGARIWSLKVLGPDGGSTSNVICALDWVASNSTTIDVVNMSLTGTNTTASTCTSGSDALRFAVCSVHGRGIPLVAAAGNQGTDAGSTVPAKYPEVIAAAAITDYDGAPGGRGLAGGCEWGTDDAVAPYSNYGSVVDIVASGTCVQSTTWDGGYGTMSGTSMATPLVAGALGLYKSMNQGSSEGSARSWLLGTASRSKSSAEGYSGNLSVPILYPGSAVAGASHPPATKGPSFGGQKLTIVSSRGSSGTNGSGRVWDNSTSTSWHTTTSGTPSSAWFDVDLGAAMQLTGVKWMFSNTGGADKMLVRTSSDRVNWEIVGTYSNSGSLQTYYGVNVNRTARYVGFSFANPNNQPVLGYVSEMQVWGTASNVFTPGTSRPVFTGSDLRIVSSRGSSNASGSGRAWDNNISTSWYTTTSTPPTSAWFDVDLGTTRQLSGIKWMFKGTTAADQMLVRTSTDRVNWTVVGTFRNGAYDSNWYGTALNRNARYVGFSFSNPNQDPQIGLVREVEIWGQPYTASTITSASLSTASTSSSTPEASPTASPTASPSASLVASPAASPGASPAASPSASPVASPAASLAASPAGIDPGTPGVEASPAPGASPAASPAVEANVPAATPEVTVEPTPTIAATEEPTATAAPTEEPTATTVPTGEPTATLVGMVVGTGGEGVRCRTAPSTDAGEITTVQEGDEIVVLGPNVEGWIPVICGDNQNGYVAAQFLAVGDDPAAPAVETGVVEDDAATEELAEETAVAEETVVEETMLVEEPTATVEVVPTDEPADVSYPIVDTADSEQSGTGYQAVDGDSGTFWLVQPSITPDETWLLLDLGQVQPVDRVSWELGVGGSLPRFEIWLSEDGSTWWNASEVNGWNLEAGVTYEASLNVWTRYVMIVIPDVDESGLSGVGGFSEIEVWPADEARSLDALGSPVTPEPEPTDVPVEETVEDISTDEAVTEEALPEEEGSGGEATIEETPPDGPEPGSEPEGTAEETPLPEN